MPKKVAVELTEMEAAEITGALSLLLDHYADGLNDREGSQYKAAAERAARKINKARLQAARMED